MAGTVRRPRPLPAIPAPVTPIAPVPPRRAPRRFTAGPRRRPGGRRRSAHAAFDEFRGGPARQNAGGDAGGVGGETEHLHLRSGIHRLPDPYPLTTHFFAFAYDRDASGQPIEDRRIAGEHRAEHPQVASPGDLSEPLQVTALESLDRPRELRGRGADPASVKWRGRTAPLHRLARGEGLRFERDEGDEDAELGRMVFAIEGTRRAGARGKEAETAEHGPRGGNRPDAGEGRYFGERKAVSAAPAPPKDASSPFSQKGFSGPRAGEGEGGEGGRRARQARGGREIVPAIGPESKLGPKGATQGVEKVGIPPGMLS